ncbi:nuclear transport factor 2 family protein [Sphingomonas tabacisoli]|uniref:Nuclear transport factor 2 family protein n=1 Tax=Sphingomonas tabacisoli TaxID=2249466 RepID=A0ABW4I901_9SPHN
MSDFLVIDAGVRQLQARFIDAAWRQDANEFAACFTADGVWKIAGMEIKGRAAIAEACRTLLGRCERVQLILMPPILEVTADGAIGRSHVTEFAKMRDGSSAMTFGIYHDRFAQEDGRWRYRSRHWSFAYRGPADLSAPFVDTPDFGPFPGFPGPDEPTYVRPS